MPFTKDASMNGCKGAGTIVLPVVQRLVSCSIFWLMLILFFRAFQTTHNPYQLSNREPVHPLQDTLSTDHQRSSLFTFPSISACPMSFLASSELLRLIHWLLFYHPNPQNQHFFGIVASLTHPPCYFYNRFLLFFFSKFQAKYSVTETCEMGQKRTAE